MIYISHRFFLFRGVSTRSDCQTGSQARAGLFGITLSLHSYATLRNGYAAPTIPNAKLAAYIRYAKSLTQNAVGLLPGFALPQKRKLFNNFLTELANASWRCEQGGSHSCCCGCSGCCCSGWQPARC